MSDAGLARRVRFGAGAGPVIGLRIWVGPDLWRIGPAWAVLAAAVASAASLTAGAFLLRLIGAAFLADSVWGVVWRMTSLPSAEESGLPVEAVRLPYYQPTGPAGRLLQFLRRVIADASWRELFASVAAALILSVLLGVPALLLTLVAWAVALWGWFLAQMGRQPAACDALLNVGLPWLLGWTLALPESALWRPTAIPFATLAPGLAFTVLGWGARRAFLSSGRRSVGLWLGQAAVIAVPIGLQNPIASIVVTLLLLPPAWLIWQGRLTDTDLGQALSYSGPWWLAAMLVSAVTLNMR